MSFNVTILGSSGALPAFGRFPSCQLVEIQNRYFLVDCGEGVQIQLMKYQTNFHRINHILISHLHGDHYLGLMGLLFTKHLLRRTNDLHIYMLGGKEDAELCEFIQSKTTNNSITDLSGKLNFLQSISLMRDAKNELCE